VGEGRYVGEQVQLGSKGRLEEMLGALDQHLRSAHKRLADVWRKFDRDGSGVLERRELQGFLAALLPNCSEK
jgi:Ca2+-binding EF-hand superfamily protein